MNLWWRLARGWLLQQRSRLVLTALAVALASSLVVLTVGGHRAAVAQTEQLARGVLGAWDVLVSPRIAARPDIDADLEAALRADPRSRQVLRLDLVWVWIADTADSTYYDGWTAAALGIDSLTPPMPLATGRWFTPGADRLEGVLAGGLARNWDVAVGDVLQTEAPSGPVELTVVGITAEELAHPDASGIFMHPADVRALAGTGPSAARLFVALQDEADPAAFIADWAEPADAAAPPARLKDLQAIAADLGTDDALGRVRSMGAAGAAIAFLAAAFIVATAMAAGVGERARQLALLRCVGMTRAQVAGAVLAEAAVLGLAGGIGGLLLGRLWLGLLGLFDPVFHPTSALGDPLADLLALLAAIGVGLLAALAPARAATRVRPLDVIGGAASPARAPVLRGILGALLVTGAWAVAFLLPLPPLADLVALPLLAIGCWALAPALVLLCGRVLATPVARVCGVLPALLRQQLGQRLRLAGGTALTLAVCLGLAMTLQIWGRSMVTPFLPSPQLPQLIIGLFPAGLPPEAVGELTGVTGIDHERALALQADQFLLAPALHGRVDAGEATVMVLGLDPAAALTGPDPLLSLDYAAGLDAAAAAAALADGGALVPPDLSQRLGIGIGEELPLLTRDGVVSVTIRGHAALQGWHWVTKLGRMRSLPGRPLAPIIVPPETAARLGIDRVRHLWADAAPGADRQQIRAQLQPIVARHAGAYQQPNYGPAVSGDAVVKLVDTRDVARRMQERSDAVIWVLGAIPLAALLVAGLGVAQAMAAGIRSRSWEFGIMRSVGLDGAACGRLVLAEAVLLALAAALLAALFGIAAAQLAIAPSLQAFQAGAAASLIVPWIELLADLCIGVAAALLAAWIPARRLARREPLQLLQGGRAAA